MVANPYGTSELILYTVQEKYSHKAKKRSFNANLEQKIVDNGH